MVVWSHQYSFQGWPRASSKQNSLSKRQVTACLQFARWHLKDFENTSKAIFWSDETNIEPFVQNLKHYVWRTPWLIIWLIPYLWCNTVVKSIMLKGTSQQQGLGDLSKEGRINAAKYRKKHATQSTWPETEGTVNLSAQQLPGAYSQISTEVALGQVLELPSQGPDSNPMEHWWRDLNMAVHRCLRQSMRRSTRGMG